MEDIYITIHKTVLIIFALRTEPCCWWVGERGKGEGTRLDFLPPDVDGIMSGPDEGLKDKVVIMEEDWSLSTPEE